MSQKLRVEPHLYGSYKKLAELMSQANFDPNAVNELNLSNQKANLLPPTKSLELFSNLQILVLSDNELNQFDAGVITKHLPRLIALDLQNNRIESLDCIIDLGVLKELQILEIGGNPFCSHMNWMNILTELLYPQKLKTYDPVKILTADYHAIPNPCYSQKEYEELQQNQRINTKFHQEINPHQMRSKVNKYSHKNTLAKYATVPCPVPRYDCPRSRWPGLPCLRPLRLPPRPPISTLET